MISEKVLETHLSRKAILYIRQSSQQQVVRNEESRNLQYAMESRLRELGWKVVEIIDEDLGRSAAGTTQRSGFERLIAEVCLGQVGAVAAREVSRFSRNSRDWQQLVEVCKMVGTLLIDQETVYDPRHGNDRLLLGVKGTLSEYELDILRLRALDARIEKARRGELRTIVPAGYTITTEGEVAKDPDQRVRDAIDLVFRKFIERGSVRQTLLWFLEERIDLPSRCHDGREWKIVWRRPKSSMLFCLLKNPIFAGAYAYGRKGRELTIVAGQPRRVTRRRPMDQWHALIYDHHPSYVERAEFERIQEMIAKNNKGLLQAGAGAPQKGPGLLSSLLRCRRCGRKLSITYSGRLGNVGRYVCVRGTNDTGVARCISFGGGPLEQVIQQELLRVVSPGAIAAARNLESQMARQRDDVSDAIALSLKEARYLAERARRQYEVVEPENRLVAEELERRWNAALGRVAELERRCEEEQAKRAAKSDMVQVNLGNLAADLEKVWFHPLTDSRLKKRILRTAVEEVVVDVDRGTGTIQAVIHWKGGVHTEAAVPYRRRGQNSIHTNPETIGVIRNLALVCNDVEIAGYLNRNGLKTGQGNRWIAERVRSARSHHKIDGPASTGDQRRTWLTLTEAADLLNVASSTVRHAVERGVIKVLHPLDDGPWLLNRSELDDASVRSEMDRIRRRDVGTAVQDRDEPNLFNQAVCPDEAV